MKNNEFKSLKYEENENQYCHQILTTLLKRKMIKTRKEKELAPNGKPQRKPTRRRKVAKHTFRS